MRNIIREITPIKNDDFFVLLNHAHADFDFPTHHHPEYELNVVTYFEGTRIVGDSIENVKGADMVLVGPSIYHSWEAPDNFKSHVITIQFSQELFNTSFVKRKLFKPIKDLLDLSSRGILFSKETQQKVRPKIDLLAEKKEFDSVIEFLSILYDLALAKDNRLLSSPNFSTEEYEIKSRRIKKVYQYISANYQNKIRIDDVAALINMTNSSFCHFFKRRTQKSFVDFLNDMRVAEAARMLIETTHTISEISYNCGFNNISNFNRIFKKRKGITPSEFRETSTNLLTFY